MRSSLPIQQYSRGFTLVEILIVIAILGMLATIVIVNLVSAPKKAEIAKGKSFDADIYQAIGLDTLSFWNFEDEASRDMFEGENNGTLINVTSEEGIKGKALSFNGTNARVTFAKSFFRSPPSSFTVTLWARPSLVPTKNAVLFYSTRNVEFMIGYNTDGKFFTSYKLDPTGWEGIPAEKMSDPNQWHHVAVEWSEKKVNLYVNGKLAATRVPSGKKFATTPSGNPAFGAIVRPTGTDNFFSGLLDEIHIYEETFTKN